MINFKLTILLVLGANLLLGCTSGGDSFDNSDQVGSDGLSGVGKNLSATTDSSGAATLSFNVDSSTTSFQIISSTDSSGLIGLESLRAPDGSVVFDGETAEKATGQDLFDSAISVVNYPTLPTQPSVQPGNYSITLLAAKNSKGASLANAPINITVVQKSDMDRSGGRLNLTVIYAGPVANNRKSKDSIKSALETSGSIMQSAGISYSIKFVERPDLPSPLPNPLDRSNAQFYESLSNDAGARAIPLVFGVDLKGRGSRYDREYAITANTPLPVIPTARTVVAFSVLALARNNGEFDYDSDGDRTDSGQRFNDETKHMASVITHEIGRVLGLKNTVDFGGGKAVDNDLLSDTQSCNSPISCEIEGQTTHNIMFPYAIDLDGDNDFVMRDLISDQQKTIMNSSVLVE